MGYPEISRCLLKLDLEGTCSISRLWRFSASKRSFHSNMPYTKEPSTILLNILRGKGLSLVRSLCTFWETLHSKNLAVPMWGGAGTRHASLDLILGILGASPRGKKVGPGTAPLRNPKGISRKAFHERHVWKTLTFLSRPQWPTNRTDENRIGESRPHFRRGRFRGAFVGSFVGAFVGVLEGLKTGKSTLMGPVAGASWAISWAHSWVQLWAHSWGHSWVGVRFRLLCASPTQAASPQDLYLSIFPKFALRKADFHPY